ncbi:uncharacterized protein LOC763117 isoform X1 [Strongylocentrotus purpuratus]|uniref:FLYWCH-type domain-containing protein n=1 Tax=Strongylocentrotus purpuratus TaxID=7668 RepID=A0A7M7G130_STRPU|nr:uncharacterized protein LOC763117 isoform X1 [Strongylocentrotus purpuratus]
MEWIDTERGGLKLLLDGFIYVRKKDLANGWESFECELRRNRNECKARVKVLGADEFRDKTEHNHPPDHGKADAYKLKAAMKRRAVSTDESPQQILMATLPQATDEGVMALPGPTNMRRIIRRQRQDHRHSLAMRNSMIPEIMGDQRPPLETRESLLVLPGIDSVCQDDQEPLAIRNAEALAVPLEDQRSSLATEEGPMAPLGVVCQDVAEDLVIGNSEDLGYPGDHRSPFDLDKGLEARPGLDNVQQDEQEIMMIRNSENSNVSEDRTPSTATEEDPTDLPGLDSSRKQENNPEALSAMGNSGDQGLGNSIGEGLGNSGGQGPNESSGIVRRPFFSTLLKQKRSFGHRATGPRAKVPTGSMGTAQTFCDQSSIVNEPGGTGHSSESVIVSDCT